MSDFWKIQKALDGPHGDNPTLYARTKDIIAAANFPTPEQFSETFSKLLIDRHRELHIPFPHIHILLTMSGLAAGLYAAEQLKDLPPNPALYGTYAFDYAVGQMRDLLLQHQRKALNPQATLDTLTKTLLQSCIAISTRLPPLAQYHEGDDDTSPTIKLIDALSDVGFIIEDALQPFSSPEAKELSLFRWFNAQIKMNSERIMERSGKKQPILPSQYNGTATEIVHCYLHDTPFTNIFDARIPFVIPEQNRFSGHWIVAPPGRGKTTLLHSMFLEDIQRQASIIVMDSKGDLINPIKELKAVEDRLVLIEPDAQFPLALNPLDVQSVHIPHAIALIEYILSGLLDAKFTNLQSALFRHVLPAILQAIPSPTIETLKLVLANGLSPEQTANLDGRLRQFFADKTNGFYSKTYAETRSQIIWRLDFILTNDTMRTMFASPTTRLKMADAMNSGKIIIIDASKAILGDDGSEFYQRFFLALILGAAQARSALNPSQKLPVYCYLDECQWVRNDQKLATILDECRSQKIALILAHQRTEQITNPNVLSAMSNCAIRFANSDDEAKFLAPKLRCDPEFLYSLPQGTFAAYIRDYTRTALALQIPYHDMRRLPRMTPAEQSALRDKMRVQYSDPKTLPAAPLEPQMSETAYQRLFDDNRERVSAPPEAPKSAPSRRAAAPVASIRPDAGGDTEAGKDW